MGKSTSTKIAAAAILAGLAAGADANKENVLGTWAGTNQRGIRHEAKIVAIEDDGGVTGTVCAVHESGHMKGDRLTGIEDWPYTGPEVSANAGDNFIVFTPQGKRLKKTETYTTKKGAYASTTTMLRRTKKLRCAHLFADTPRTLSDIEGDTGDTLVGYWSGQFRRGGPAEALIERIGENGETVIRSCWIDKRSGLIGIRDYYPGAPTTQQYDAAKGKLTLGMQVSPDRFDRTTYTLLTNDTVSVTARGKIGREDESEAHAVYWRGAKPEGCLAMTHLRSHRHTPRDEPTKEGK